MRLQASKRNILYIKMNEMGEYYLYRPVYNHNSIRGNISKREVMISKFIPWFLVGVSGNISSPKVLEGKRVMFKVEIVEDTPEVEAYIDAAQERIDRFKRYRQAGNKPFYCYEVNKEDIKKAGELSAQAISMLKVRKEFKYNSHRTIIDEFIKSNKAGHVLISRFPNKRDYSMSECIRATSKFYPELTYFYKDNDIYLVNLKVVPEMARWISKSRQYLTQPRTDI